MSSEIIAPPQDKSLQLTPEKVNYKKEKMNFILNRRMTRISHKVRPESALMTMVKLLVEHRDQINIVDSVLTINSEDLDLVQKLNYCMEFLAHIPFSFKYSKTQTKILLDFFHLEDEMNLINNMEK